MAESIYLGIHAIYGLMRSKCVSTWQEWAIALGKCQALYSPECLEQNR